MRSISFPMVVTRISRCFSLRIPSYIGGTFRQLGNRYALRSLFTPSSSISSEQLIEDCLKVRSSLQILNDKFKGPLEKSSQRNTLMPFVFLLGE